MAITVRYFALLRDRVGTPSETITLAVADTVESMWTRLVSTHSSLRDLEVSIRFAVNGAFAEPKQPLHDGDVLALLPPMSGG